MINKIKCILMCIVLSFTSYALFRYSKYPINDCEIIGKQSILSVSQDEFITQINKQHPRILVERSDFERIKFKMNTDMNIKLWFEQIKVQIDKNLDTPIIPYNIYDGLRLKTSSSNKIIEFSFMYKVTGEERYAQRAWLELENICSKYPDWNPNHFLDTATLAYGAGVGYDWLYDYLTEEQRAIVKNSIVEKALEEAIKLYKGNETWTTNEYNWNLVCNSGIAISALAIMEEDKDITTEALEYSLRSLNYGLKWFSIDGSTVEGPSYWAYGTKYLVYLLSSLESSMNATYDILSYSGLKDTPGFPVYMTGKQGTFNYSDSTNSMGNGSELLLWFSDYFNKPELTWYHKYIYKKKKYISIYDILWYKPNMYKSSNPPKELDKYYTKPEVVTMRSDWEDDFGTFVGFKGAVNGSPHGDLDAGTFVYDSIGIRWVHDLGSENYNLPGYWNYKEDGERATYYRKRAEGHNTIVISPDKAPDQSVKCEAPIIYTELNKDNRAKAAVDLTPAYSKYANNIMRSIELANGRKDLIIYDDIDLKSPKTVYWQIHTQADCEILENGKVVLLKQNNKEVYVKLVSDTSGKFEIRDAKPYPTSSNPIGQTPNEGFKKVVFKIPNAYKESLKIAMTPIR